MSEALIDAVKQGNLTDVARLLTHNPKSILQVEMYTSRSALHYAVQAGNEKILALLLAHRPRIAIDKADHDGLTATHLAASQGNERAMAQLLAYRPDLRKKCSRARWTALHYAASQGHELIVAQLLANKPQLVDQQEVYTITPLFLAAEEGHSKVVALLLAKNATVTQETLFATAKKGHVGIVAQLLAHSPQLTDATCPETGNTALHCAVSHEEVVAQLLAHKPSLIDAKNMEDGTTLFLAAKLHNEKAVELLLAQKPEQVFDVDNNGDPLLYHILHHRNFSDLQKRVWEMNPRALHTLNKHGEDLYSLVMNTNKRAFEWLKWKVDVDETLQAFEKAGRSLRNRAKFCNSPYFQTLSKSFMITLGSRGAPRSGKQLCLREGKAFINYSSLSRKASSVLT